SSLHHLEEKKPEIPSIIKPKFIAEEFSFVEKNCELENSIIHLFKVAIKKFINRMKSSQKDALSSIKNYKFVHSKPLFNHTGISIGKKVKKCIPKTRKLEMPLLSSFGENDLSIAWPKSHSFKPRVNEDSF